MARLILFGILIAGLVGCSGSADVSKAELEKAKASEAQAQAEASQFTEEQKSVLVEQLKKTKMERESGRDAN